VSSYPILAGFAYRESETGKTEDESDTGCWLLDTGLLMLINIIMSGCPKDSFGELVEAAH
jgi:hypothetical protein